MRKIFSADTRGVSEVVGAVLLLGILILLLTSYQAVVVPNQNAATEFEHNQQVEDEFVDVRNAIIEARSAGRSTFASVKLGAQYQSRILAINPPPPSGTVETTRQVNISVTEGGSGDPLRLDERPLENNFIEYAPRYFEYSNSGTIRFENTVTYHDYGETNVLLTDQTLLRGSTVSLIPVEGTFRESGTRRIAIEPIPGVLETVPVEDPEIIVPTELSESDWEQLLEDELDGDDEVSVSDGTLTLELDGTYDVAYAPVGVNRVPREGQRGESGSEINPAAPGDVQLIGANWKNNQNTVELTFRNSADDTSFTNGRINFYTGSGGTPNQADFINVTDGTNNPRGTDWVIADDFNNLEPNIELEGDRSTTSVGVVFDSGVQENNDFFIITFTLESGQQATYFIGGTFIFDDDGDGANGNGDTLSFVDSPTATSDQDSNSVTEVTFDYTVSNPDNVDYELEFNVENEDSDLSSVGPLTRPASPQTVSETDGDALPNQMNQVDRFLDVEIVLINQNGSVVETRSGRINERDETITLN